MNVIRPAYGPSDQRSANKPWLNKNETITTLHKEISRKVIASIEDNIPHSYPDLFLLYKAISNYVDKPICNLYIDNGSDGIIRRIFETFTRTGDLVFITSPTFAMYSVYSKIYKLNTINVPYDLYNSSIQLNVDLFGRIHELRPKLVCLPNPDSPTGTIVEDSLVDRIANELNEYGGILFIDEAYFGFYNHTYASWVDKFENIIIGRSFSKAWGAAGARVGFCIASEKLIASMSMRRGMYEIGAIASEYILKLIEYRDVIEREAKNICAIRNHICTELNNSGVRSLNTNANFLHVYKHHLRAGTLQDLHDFCYYREFQPEPLSGYIRLTVGDSKDMIKITDIIKRKN